MPRLLSVALLALAATSVADEAVLPVPESLIADGLPPIPAAIAEKAGRYAEYRTASFLDWHPRRREMLIGTRFADTPQVHQVARPLGARRQLTFRRERTGGARYDPKDGLFVVFSSDEGGGEFYQNYLLDLSTGESRRLTDGRSRNSLGVWSRDGARMAYTSTRRNGRDTDLYLVDPRDPRSDRLFAQVEGGGWSPQDWSPDGRRLLVGQYASVTDSRLWIFDTATGERRPIVPPPAEGARSVSYAGGEFSADGRSVYATSDRDSDRRRLVRIDVESGRETVLSEARQWDIESFEASPSGKWIAFSTNEDGVDVLHVMTVAGGHVRRVAGLPAGVLGSPRWHRTAPEFAFSVQTARAPGDVWSYDVLADRLERWTASETAFPTDALPQPVVVRWKSFDGRAISGLLYRPPARFTGPRPVIVSIHGGPEGQSRPNFLGRSNYYLNELGVAMLYPNVRGSSGFGREFSMLDNGTKREDSVKDIGALLDWIATQPDLARDRVLVTGGSYGGYMTLAVATLYPERIRAAVDSVGISNFNTFLSTTQAYRQDLRRAEYGDERDPEMKAFFDRISPLNRAARIARPLFVVQGANDPRVPRTESDQMVATVRSGGKPVWYLVGKDEGHGFSKKGNQDFQFYATVAFVERYLLGDD